MLLCLVYEMFENVKRKKFVSWKITCLSVSYLCLPHSPYQLPNVLYLINSFPAKEFIKDVKLAKAREILLNEALTPPPKKNTKNFASL